MEISPKRILYLDVLRCFAIILIVLEHVTRLFSYNFGTWLACSHIFSLTRIGVPLFFAISGSLLLTRKYKIKEFIGKRFKRIFPPFIFWIIIYIILGVYIWHFPLTFTLPIEIIFGITDFSAPFWFIWTLIGAYLLIPVLSSFIREEGMKGLEYLLIIMVVLSILYTIGLFDYPKIKFDFKVLFYFFPVLGYFILGSYIENKKFNISNNKLFLIGVTLFIVGIIGHFIQIYFKGLGQLTLMPIDFLNIFVIMEVAGLILAVKYMNFNMISKNSKPLKERTLGKIIVIFSSCAFGIYFSHYIIMELLLYQSPLACLRHTNFIPNYPISFLLVLFISWGLILIMSKIPILKIGSGR